MEIITKAAALLGSQTPAQAKASRPQLGSPKPAHTTYSATQLGQKQDSPILIQYSSQPPPKKTRADYKIAIDEAESDDEEMGKYDSEIGLMMSQATQPSNDSDRAFTKEWYTCGPSHFLWTNKGSFFRSITIWTSLFCKLSSAAVSSLSLWQIIVLFSINKDLNSNFHLIQNDDRSLALSANMSNTFKLADEPFIIASNSSRRTQVQLLQSKASPATGILGPLYFSFNLIITFFSFWATKFFNSCVALWFSFISQDFFTFFLFYQPKVSFAVCFCLLAPSSNVFYCLISNFSYWNNIFTLQFFLVICLRFDCTSSLSFILCFCRFIHSISSLLTELNHHLKLSLFKRRWQTNVTLLLSLAPENVQPKVGSRSNLKKLKTSLASKKHF